MSDDDTPAPSPVTQSHETWIACAVLAFLGVLILLGVWYASAKGMVEFLAPQLLLFCASLLGLKSYFNAQAQKGN